MFRGSYYNGAGIPAQQFVSRALNHLPSLSPLIVTLLVGSGDPACHHPLPHYCHSRKTQEFRSSGSNMGSVSDLW